MQWVYNGQLHNTLTISFYASGSTYDFEVRATTAEGEVIEKSYLCLLDPTFVGNIRARVKGTDQWYRVAGIWDTECFIGTIPEYSFRDIEIRIELPSTVASGAYRLPFILLHGDYEHGPSRTLCAEDSGDNDPLWGDDEFGIPLWQGSTGGCPYSQETAGSYCGPATYAFAVPSETIEQFKCVTTFTEDDTLKMQVAGTADFAEATVVGMMVDETVTMVQVAGAASVQSSDGRYIYEHGGQEVDSGGFLQDIWHDEVRVYDTVTGAWRDLGTCGESKQRDHTLTIVDDVLYIFGGSDGTGNYYSSLYAFDLSALTCSELTSAPTARAGSSSIVVADNGDGETEIHYVSGWNASGPINDVDYYNIDQDAWNTVAAPEDPGEATLEYPYVGWTTSGWSIETPDLSFGEGFGACYNGQLHWFDQGGHRIHKYPNTEGGWTLLDAPTGLAIGEKAGFITNDDEDMDTNIPLSATLNGKIYVSMPFAIEVFATNPTGPHPVWIYDPATNSWSSTASMSPSLPVEFWDCSALDPHRSGIGTYGTKIYFWGTQPEYYPYTDENYTQLLIFDTETNTWDASIHQVGDYPWGPINKGYIWTDESVKTGLILDNFLFLYGAYDSLSGGSYPERFGFQIVNLDDLTSVAYGQAGDSPWNEPLNMIAWMAFFMNQQIYWFMAQSGSPPI